jgi:hypothetical protein
MKSREKLINAILLLSGDELECSDFRNMAKESDDELIDRLIHIAKYYHSELQWYEQ